MSTLRDQLYAIRSKHGELTPALVVEEARPKSSPLHHCFEWDNREAAEKWRLTQAAGLIRSVKLRYADGPVRDSKTVREFVAMRREGDMDDPDAPLRSTYEPLEEVLADPFSRELLLREAEREFRRFERKYGHLQEFALIVGRKTA